MAENSPFTREIDFEYGVATPLSPLLRRFVAHNPGPLTFKGTNVYVLGHGEVAIIDPGPDDETHIAALLASLQGEIITRIFLTHTHKDHSGGLARLQARTGAQTYGFCTSGAPRGAYQRNEAGQLAPSGELVTGFADLGFKPDHPLDDGGQVMGEGWTLRAVHTPGHAPDHLCYCLLEEKALFTGDHIMPWSTSVVAPPEGNMRDYMASLSDLSNRDDELYLPGHGGRVRKPRRLVRAYVLHRQWREQSILKAIKEGYEQVNDILPLLYKGLDDALITAASLSILAHLEHLLDKGKLQKDKGDGLDARFSVVN
ncbi:MAG: MBL fold metallo-hydrolase [bacterium]|nr:MBL fold metallo-hydrolase [bacterium]